MPTATPNFSASQLIGLPNQIVVTDTSTDLVSVASRTVTVQDAQGNYLAHNTVWALVNTSITLDVLTSDKAVFVTTNWLDINGDILYTLTDLFEFNQYNSQFSVDLTRAIASSPMIMQDNDYWMNKIILRVNIDDADQAVSLADDIMLAQMANDRATYLRLNQSKYF